METILKIAASVSTPLALGGLIAGFLFLTFRQILSMNVFPQLSTTHGSRIIIKIINVFLIISVISIVLGFIAYILPKVLNAYYPKLDSEYVDVGTDEDKPFEEIIKAVKEGRNVTIEFAPKCESVKSAIIEKGDHEGNNIKEFLENLKQRVKGSQINYAVEKKGERRYEIICP